MKNQKTKWTRKGQKWAHRLYPVVILGLIIIVPGLIRKVVDELRSGE